MYRFGFILEQTLGHKTHSQNLRETITRDPKVEAYWGLPAYDRSDLLGKMPLIGNNWTLQAGLRTRKILGDLNNHSSLDVLFFHTQVTAVLSSDWLRRIPSVVSLDATPRQYDRLGSFYDHTPGPNWLENWKWRLNRDCFCLAKRLVTWSDWARDGLIDEYEVQSEKIIVIPPGVDCQAWARPFPQDPHPSPVRILFVGGNLERKGGYLLLEAFRNLRTQIKASPGGNGEPSLELHLVTHDFVAPEPGVFIYSAMKPNSQPLKDLFFQSDIFCLPTQGDCLPMALSEAGAAGLPTISTRLTAIPEIIQDGETGFLVPPGDLGALIVALNRLILDPALRLRQGKAAEQFVRQRFDSRLNSNRLLDLMKQVSAESPAEKRSQ